MIIRFHLSYEYRVFCINVSVIASYYNVFCNVRVCSLVMQSALHARQSGCFPPRLHQASLISRNIAPRVAPQVLY